ncbi:hypothetical protein HY418_01860 [Candidatus Kaiserbacteria bacterium]|nr:hypothetical protein [Candidatus Kaiserbacteria bacterium]
MTFLIALILHIHGYGLLGKKYNSPLLTRSAYVLIGEVVLLGILLVARIPAPLSPNPFMSTYIDAATGLLMLLFIVPVLLFALAVGRLYKTLGLVWTASAAAIIPLAVIFTWTPWPVALVGAISTYFFYKQTGYDF